MIRRTPHPRPARSPGSAPGRSAGAGSPPPAGPASRSLLLVPLLAPFLLSFAGSGDGPPGNSAGAPSHGTPAAALGFELFDANPIFTADRYVAPRPARELLGLEVTRRGTVADGVSRLVVRVETPGPGTVSFAMEGGPADGALATPWGSETVADADGGHFAFALYAPPESFGSGSGRRQPGRLLGGEVEYRDVPIEARFSPRAGGPPQPGTHRLRLARPPLVLVHGTFDGPDGAWREASERGLSMVATLKRVGFRPFTVDYEGSNGTGTGGGSWLFPGSSFRDNRRVVLENPGGIRDALSHYRDGLGLAAARADVVAHSLGGLLARVLASERYREEGDEPYRTAENFNEGWIHRLVTISTPHHGSDLPEVLRFLSEAEMDGRSWSEWLTARGIVLAAGWLKGARADVGAVRDQIPRSPALRRIGATAVPSHAIVTTADYNRLRDRKVDEDGLYYDLFRYLAMAFHYNPGLLDRFLEHRIEQREERPDHLRRSTSRGGDAPPPGISRAYGDPSLFRATYREALDAEWEYWQTLRDEKWIESVEHHLDRPMLPPRMVEVDPADPDPGFWESVYEALEGAATYALGFDVVEPERGGERIAPSVPHTLVEQFRALVFHNDWNDGTVRYESQTGSLEEPYVTHVEEGVLHSFSPRYGRVQNAVVDALKEDRFDRRGFPPAGRWLPSWLPETRLEPEWVTGDEAVCWSGMVPVHARKWAEVVQEDSVIVLVRPVNPDATDLIAGGAATKPMAIKGKSSSWGPQVGYIPVRQRYSKLWRVYRGEKRTEQIAKYDGEVREVLSGDPPLAVRAPLMVEVAGRRWEVREDPSEEEAPEAIRLVRETGEESWEVCDWRTNGEGFSRERAPSPDSCETVESLDDLSRLEVLASGTETDEEGRPRYLTADYDFLAFGLHLPGAPHQPPVFTEEDFDPRTGFITPRQEEVLRKLNEAVRNGREAYPGGNVAHHGPENQYPKSPYVDYPVTAFEPGAREPRILSIPQGPPGFRDLHLKRYFHRKRGEGFDLYENPSPRAGWRWSAWREYDPIRGWDDRDARDLPPYVAELPDPEDCEIEPAEVVAAELEEEPEPEPADALEAFVEARVAAEGAEATEVGADRAPEPGGEDALPELLIYDEIDVFFQPARDTVRTPWEWRIVRVRADGDTVRALGGTYTPRQGEFDTTERAPPGAPAAFHAVLDRSMWREGAAAGPGTYVLQTCVPEATTLMGQTTGYAGCDGPWTQDGEERPARPWRDEGRFEVGSADLRLKGFIGEQGAVARDDERGPWLSLENVRLEGGTGTADVVHTRDVCVHPDAPDEPRTPPCGARGERWRAERWIERTRVTLELPRVLALEEEVMGELAAGLAPVDGRRRQEPVLTLHVLDAAAEPARGLGESDRTVSALVHVPRADADDADPRRTSRVTLADGSRLFHVHNTYRRSRVGEPGRHIGEWVRDPDGHWFLPVSVEVDGRRLYTFAVYGVAPGPYTGPVPRAPGATAVVAAGEAAGAAAGGDDPSGAGEGAGGAPTGAGPGLDVRTGAVDPTTLDPTAPEVAGHIREWISVARPPAAARRDNDTRYDEWGRVVGRSATNVITPGPPPDDRGSRGPVEYVWGNRDDLDSVDHCTLGEYVTRSIGGGSTADCRGRYGPDSPLPVPRAVGRGAAEATAALEASGFEPAVEIVRPADSPEEATRVVRQDPGPGVDAAPGSRVELGITGPYTAVVRVPDLAGMPGGEAIDSLLALGLAPQPEVAAEATSRREAGAVSALDPAPGAAIAEGGTVVLELYGPFSETVSVPSLVGERLEDAERAVREAGLRPRSREVADAPSPDREGEVTRQDPPGGSEVAPGALVALEAYGSFPGAGPDPDPGPEDEVGGWRQDQLCGSALGGILELARRGELEAARQMVEACPGAEPFVEEIARSLGEEDEDPEDEAGDPSREVCEELFRSSRAAFRDGDLEEALRIARRARGDDCEWDPPVSRIIGDLEDQIEEAEEREEAEEDRRRRCETLLDRAEADGDAGRYDDALERLDRARALDCGRRVERIMGDIVFCSSQVEAIRLALRAGDRDDARSMADMIEPYGCVIPEEVASGLGGNPTPSTPSTPLTGGRTWAAALRANPEGRPGRHRREGRDGYTVHRHGASGLAVEHRFLAATNDGEVVKRWRFQAELSGVPRRVSEGETLELTLTGRARQLVGPSNDARVSGFRLWSPELSFDRGFVLGKRREMQDRITVRIRITESTPDRFTIHAGKKGYASQIAVVFRRGG